MLYVVRIDHALPTAEGSRTIIAQDYSGTCQELLADILEGFEGEEFVLKMIATCSTATGHDFFIAVCPTRVLAYITALGKCGFSVST